MIVEHDNFSGEIIPTKYIQIEINARDTKGKFFTPNCVAKDSINKFE